MQIFSVLSSGDEENNLLFKTNHQHSILMKEWKRQNEAVNLSTEPSLYCKFILFCNSFGFKKT